jgi:hypothetical protein
VVGDGLISKVKGVVFDRDFSRDLTFGGKFSLILKTIIVRVLILLFYLLFIVVFVGFQVTDKGHRMEVFTTMAMRNQFFNTAVIFFLISMTVQLIGGFFISGKYRTAAPINYTNVLSARTIVMHVMIVGSAVIHGFLFEGKSYVALGEILYVTIFMLGRTLLDIAHLRSQHAAEPTAISMI